jgi:hypothetical protein
MRESLPIIQKEIYYNLYFSIFRSGSFNYIRNRRFRFHFDFISIKIFFQRDLNEILRFIVYFSKKHSAQKYNYEIYDKKFSLSFARSKNNVLNTKAQFSLLKFFPITIICNILYLSNYLIENKFAESNSYSVSISKFPTALKI